MSTIQFRRGTDAEAAANNPVLARGEPGWTDEGTYKIGDGTTAWNDLEQFGSGTYIRKADDQVWVPATAFASTLGSPSLSNVNRWPVWLLDDSSTEIVSHGGLLFPSYWSTFDMTVYWVNTTANAGNVEWLFGFTRTAGDGDTMSTETGPTEAVTAGSQNVLKATVPASGTDRAVTAGDLHLLSMRRNGGSGSDTLTGDIGLVGVLLERAS